MEDCSMASSDRPHAVCIPFPAQSHIKAMLKLAKLLYQKGFHITFVNTDHSQKMYTKAGGLNGLRNFRFQTIPDGLPPILDSDEPQDIISLIGAIRRNFLAPFRELLVKLNGKSANDEINSPAVTCIVADAVAAFAITAAQEIGIPVVSSRSCAFMSFCHYRSLLVKSIAPIKGIYDMLRCFG